MHPSGRLLTAKTGVGVSVPKPQRLPAAPVRVKTSRCRRKEHQQDDDYQDNRIG